MKQSVRDAFTRFTEKFEGSVPWMYLDVKGLVTTAIGNLIDPVETALDVPFMTPDGAPASHEEIIDEWNDVKARQDLRLRGGVIFKSATKLRLTEDGIASVVSWKLMQNDTYLRKRFSTFEEMPADAQLGLLSLAWACGPAFRMPHFEAFIRAGNYFDAARESHLNDAGNPGLKPRNLANQILFHNAQVVVDAGLDPEILYYPQVLAEPPTEPMLGVA